MREREMTGHVKRWVEGGGWRTIQEKAQGAAVFEYKTEVAGKAIGFSRIEKHQINALHSATEWGIGDGLSGGVYFKISDLSLGAKPFDAVYLGGVKAYVVFGWFHKGKGYHCVCVDIRRLEGVMKVKRSKDTLEVGRGSINEDKAVELGDWAFWC